MWPHEPLSRGVGMASPATLKVGVARAATPPLVFFFPLFIFIIVILISFSLSFFFKKGTRVTFWLGIMWQHR